MRGDGPLSSFLKEVSLAPGPPQVLQLTFLQEISGEAFLALKGTEPDKSNWQAEVGPSESELKSRRDQETECQHLVVVAAQCPMHAGNGSLFRKLVQGWGNYRFCFSFGADHAVQHSNKKQ